MRKKNGGKVQNHRPADTSGGTISSYQKHIDQYSEKPEPERDFMINNQRSKAQYRKRVKIDGEFESYQQRSEDLNCMNAEESGLAMS